MDEGQALENDCLGSCYDKTMQAGKLHDHGKACGQSSTTIRLDPFAGDSPYASYHGSTHDHRDSLSTSSDEEDGSSAGADFFGLDDPEVLRRFIGICDYLLNDGDSDDGFYKLT
jgi:hypothetical protein